jgi:hypothetical protein
MGPLHGERKRVRKHWVPVCRKHKAGKNVSDCIYREPLDSNKKPVREGWSGLAGRYMCVVCWEGNQ